MAYDFPSSPAENQEFTPPGGPTYLYKAPRWTAKPAPAVVIPPGTTISDTAPASPVHGQLWWESDSGNLYIYYNDGNTTQWVVANPTGIGEQGDPGVSLVADAPPGGALPGQLWFESDTGTLYLWYNDGNSAQWVQVGGNQRFTNMMPVGSVIDSVFAKYIGNDDLPAPTYVIPIDDTIPQITEGAALINTSITPKSATNKLRFRFRGEACMSAASSFTVALFVNGVANAVAANYTTCPGASYGCTTTIEHEQVAGTTTSIAVQVRAGPANGNMRFNGQMAGRYYGGTSATTLVIEEIVG